MHLEQNSRAEESLFYVLALIGGLVTAIGLASALYMEHTGHVVTGMNNQVVWGLPHVFAIFLIVAASGVLNVASIGSVFGKAIYKSRAPLSGLLAIAMLAAGLAVIMLDLGRADRIIVAATHFNPTSVFGWNVILYPGFFAIVGLYLWMLMEKRMYPYAKPVGIAAFIWRLLLTTGTGSIFGFLVARQAYQSAMLAPMFIIMSFAWGLAVFMVVQKSMFAWNDMNLNPQIRTRMKNLLGTFIGAFCLLYVFIIGGQVYPLEIFPGMEVSSSFFDGKIDSYAPSLPEFLLGMGGVGIAFTATVIGVRILKFMPQDDIAKLESAGHLLD